MSDEVARVSASDVSRNQQAREELLERTFRKSRGSTGGMKIYEKEWGRVRGRIQLQITEDSRFVFTGTASVKVLPLLRSKLQ